MYSGVQYFFWPYFNLLFLTRSFFSCSDTVKEVPGTGQFSIKCGYSSSATSETANWTIPISWPVCQFKDSESCDPVNEIQIPSDTGLISDTTKFILKDFDGVFKCRNTSRLIYFPDNRPPARSIKIKCGSTGDFVPPEVWPTCKWPSCPNTNLPPDNSTNQLRPVITDPTPMNEFLTYICPGINVTDSGPSVLVKCQAFTNGSGVSYVFPTSWPNCRAPFVCEASSFPELPAYASSSGLVCPADNVTEFSSANCSCPAGKMMDSNVLPRCAKNGVWTAPATWPVCATVTTQATTVADTTPANNETTLTGTETTNVAETSTGSTVSDTSTEPARRKRSIVEFVYDSTKKSYVSVKELELIREKRQASKFPNYIEVMMEIQFAAAANVTGLKIADLTTVLRNITISMKGKFRPDKSDPLYLALEVPPPKQETCRDCILVQSK